MRSTKPSLVWRQIHWSRPLDTARVLGLLERIATEHSLGTVFVETRANAAGIRFLIAAGSPQIGTLTRLVTTLIPGTVLTKPETPRTQVARTKAVKVSHPSLALSDDRLDALTRAVLAALAGAHRDGDELVLQVLLGKRLAPKFVTSHVEDPRQPWWQLLTSGTTSAPAEVRTSMKTHTARHGFATAITLGVRAADPGRERSLAQGLFGALRVAETAGISLRAIGDKPARLNAGQHPARYGLRLPVTELIGLLGWPLGDGALPGVPDAHPRKLAPPATLKSTERVFAVADAPGHAEKIGIPIADATTHTVLLGPTGSGKSTALQSLICADIAAGRGCLVIDPKADLITDILARIPAKRAGDVVVIDPTDARPVGLNALADAQRDPDLVADTVLASFKNVFADNWGVRIEEVMTAALLTLSRTPGSTLVWLPHLLTNPSFRSAIVGRLDDPLGTGAFWAKYEAMNPAAQATLIAPTLNRLRSFLIRPAMRRVLGQTQPKFALSELFTHNRIVLIALNKGILGPEAARLLGSLVVGQLWPLILRQALLPPERRTITPIYIDEVQDYLALPTDLADALSQSRSLGGAFTLAHQYRAQLPESMRAAIDTNARNKITFGLSAKDASEMAAQAPGLKAEDFGLLPRFGIYANLQHGGQATGWMSGSTLPAPPRISDAAEIRAASMARYGIDANEIDTAIETELGLREPAGSDHQRDEPVGRRRP